jgi:hypothetical protein
MTAIFLSLKKGNFVNFLKDIISYPFFSRDLG